MSATELKRIARERLEETLGSCYVHNPDAAALIDAFAWSLAKGGLVILDSKNQIIHFRNGGAIKNSGKNHPT
ncbi:MAG TPA: hypothetical protein VFA77_02285 [Candidatus Eisenbacteria bacterium]|jgi:hypothetical protein|nr:hypothetical protein [Candidatus Eisenbacteria bacterium]